MPRKGETVSEETRIKMSAARRAFWDQRLGSARSTDKSNACMNCGQPARGQYCSLRCWHTSSEFRTKVGNRAQNRRVTKICTTCGNSFTVPRSNASRYRNCSWACRAGQPGYGWMHKLLKRARWTGTCEHCGRLSRELALIHGRGCISDGTRVWSDRRTDYLELCISCHRRYDYGPVELLASV
jgi:hypothetical protein